MDVVVKSDEGPAGSTSTHMLLSLLATHPGAWAQYPYEKLFQLDRRIIEPLQLAALSHRFDQLKQSIPALERLASRQNVKRVESVGDALPLFFDHRVYKSYPISLIETRDFPKLTSWLNRLTLHNLLKMDLSGLTTIDSWLSRLDDYGMMVGHSTGTTGKLSFIPRSSVEWPAWKASFNDTTRAASGVDPTREFLPTFFPGYRGGHQMALKMLTLFHIPAAGGAENYHTLYQTPMSSDLMSLAGRLQSAEDKGELERLGLDPALLQKREEMIAQGRRRGQDMEAWFTKMIEQYRGKRVKVSGSFADLTRIALAGKAKGLKCAFAPNSIISSGGGMKGFKDAPEDWQDLIKTFFGIQRISRVYGMSESIGQAPLCSSGFHHFLPYTLPILLDREAKELPRTGTQTGRLALFDLMAETYWGGFISGDQVTIHWDEDCPCGWKGPRIARDITRFAEMEGGDDKITCAGSTEAYNEFMDYVTQV
jgi:hypothetical protein